MNHFFPSLETWNSFFSTSQTYQSIKPLNTTWLLHSNKYQEHDKHITLLPCQLSSTIFKTGLTHSVALAGLELASTPGRPWISNNLPALTQCLTTHNNWHQLVLSFLFTAHSSAYISFSCSSEVCPQICSVLQAGLELTCLWSKVCIPPHSLICILFWGLYLSCYGKDSYF